jgi:hypothetical protein
VVGVFMSKNKITTVYIFLTIVTFAAYWRVNYCGFIFLDDPTYITQNTYVMNGLTWKTVLWAFTVIYNDLWHPLTIISHMLAIQCFGLDPRGHHLLNLFLHIANALLLFYVLNRMTNAAWKSAFAAALFALHPLHVESVAWVSERKDVLSAFFWMLTMIAYVFYVERPKLINYNWPRFSDHALKWI